MDFALGLLIFGWIFVAVWIPVVVFSQRKVHPRALFTLFFAELWERFSFYGMRALLTLYMVKVLFESMAGGEADVRALGIYGAYGAMVYLAPVIGGMIADRLLGFRRAVLLGGIFMALGHFVLAFEGSQLLFFASLGFIIVGNGFFKPNISSFLGTFYDQNDPRKDGAFTIFYMGVNIGAFLAPLTCGYLGERVDWSIGFGLAGIGMLIGLIAFWRNMKHFDDKGLPPDPELLEKPSPIGLSMNWTVILGCFLAVPLFAFLLNHNEFTSVILFVMGIGTLGYLLYTSFQEEKSAGQRLWVVIVLFFFHMIFWALFEQAGGSLVLFADRVVDRMVFGSEIPASVFASVNPLFIMLLAPVFSWIWVKLNQAKKEPSTPMKFFLGLAQLALGYLILVLGAKMIGVGGMVPMIFLLLMYLFHTTGELSLSPVGLSMVTKLSPKKIVGFVMGFWFLSISFAHEVAGQLGKLAANVDVDTASSAEILSGFTDVYMTWGVYVVGGAALVLLAMVPTLRKWMHGIH